MNPYHALSVMPLRRLGPIVLPTRCAQGDCIEDQVRNVPDSRTIRLTDPYGGKQMCMSEACVP